MGSQGLLTLFGYATHRPDSHLIVMPNGVYVRMVYACLGYGIMSFWAAFVFANRGSWKRKTIWILGGLLAIWFINVMRISFLLVANSEHKSMPLGIDHHTWFNMCAYGLIFGMIYLYDRNMKKVLVVPASQENKSENN